MTGPGLREKTADYCIPTGNELQESVSIGPRTNV